MSSKRKPPSASAGGGFEAVAARSARFTMLVYLTELIRNDQAKGTKKEHSFKLPPRHSAIVIRPIVCREVLNRSIISHVILCPCRMR